MRSAPDPGRSVVACGPTGRTLPATGRRCTDRQVYVATEGTLARIVLVRSNNQGGRATIEPRLVAEILRAPATSPLSIRAL